MVRLSRVGVVVGMLVGRARLAVRGSVGVASVGTLEVGKVPLRVELLGRSHDVCCWCLLVLVIRMLEVAVKTRTLFVSSWNFPRRIVLVMLLTRSAVPI